MLCFRIELVLMVMLACEPGLISDFHHYIERINHGVHVHVVLG